EKRWKEVVGACGLALQALSRSGQPPAWDCLRSVPQLKPMLAQAHEHVSSLSFESFGSQVRRADEWTFARAAKNTLREAVRYVAAETE
ncbi:unnamed protein product, partial [Polarella glacialis]